MNGVLKKILTFLYLILFFILIYVLQIFVIDGRTLFGVKPNLILISVIVVSLWFGIYKGSIYAFLTGILFDLLYGNNIGIFTISYTLCGILIGYISNNYRKENRMSLVYVTVFATFLFEFSEYIIYLFMTFTYSSIFYLIKQIIISSILNIVIVFIMYDVIYKIVTFFEEKFTDKQRLF